MHTVNVFMCFSSNFEGHRFFFLYKKVIYKLTNINMIYVVQNTFSEFFFFVCAQVFKCKCVDVLAQELV